MQKRYGDKLTVLINTTDSEEAKGYSFKSATNVLLDEELLPLETATDQGSMETLLDRRLGE